MAQSIYPGLRYKDPRAAIGSRGYTARDPEGNFWSFGTYRPE